MPRPWIDISVPVRTGMVHWPGDPEVRLERIHDLARGDVCNVSHLSCSVHTGTHMDAPLHFIARGASMDALPIEATVGPARVIEIQDEEAIKPEALIEQSLKPGERILFKTRNSHRSWRTNRFDEDFVFISKEAAEFLTEKKVQTVGVDYLSVGGYRKDGIETHQAILGAGIWIIEGLNLAKVKPGRYDLVCLPIKLLGAEGAPTRAILRPSGKTRG